VLNPVHLRTLRAVVRTHSFATAAKDLGYTPSAVSQQMSALERETRLHLFERGARSVEPTRAALSLAERSGEALAVLDSLTDDVRALAGGRLGTLRLGSFPTASQRLLPAVLAHLSRTLPEVRIEIEEAEPDVLVPEVSDRRIDVAIVYEYDSVPRAWPRSLRRDPLFSEPLVLLVPAARARAYGSSRLADLAQESWISTLRGTAGATCFERLCAREGFVPEIAFRSNDYEVVTKFVGEGLGLALVPQHAVPGTDAVSQLAVADCDVRRHTVALYRRVGGSPLVTPAVDALKECATTI
jgi:DNA-binding transcriptional LysR family regulator